MDKKQKDYTFIHNTRSICPECLTLIPAKTVIRNNHVFLDKTCPVHGKMSHLLEEDSSYWLNRHFYNKPGTVSATQTATNTGCPYDCGLCPHHEQHTCIAVIEITGNCNMNCPVCYAHSASKDFLPIDCIEKMITLFRDSESGKPEILQISGGEPSLHPQIEEIIRISKKLGVKHTMLNTNGRRIAQEPGFADTLKKFTPGFEVYLQFDGFTEGSYKLRESNLYEEKKTALKILSDRKIPVTLVATVAKGINEHEIGRIISLGLSSRNIRGINFQPLGFFGKAVKLSENYRITLTGILSEIEKQCSEKLKKSDFIPLPCNVEGHAVSFLIDGIPLARHNDFRRFLPQIRNTFAFDADDFSRISRSDCSCMKEFLNDHFFRISVSAFQDIYNFTPDALQKECVHILTTDFKKIPFSSYNLFYR